MKPIFIIFCFLIANTVHSQNNWDSWNARYTFKNPLELIAEEEAYAHKIETEKKEYPYYVAAYYHRFIATYTGNERKIDKDILQSMKNVFKLKINPQLDLNEITSTEFEFNIGETTLWMPIQDVLIFDFKNEVATGSEVLLFTIITNEHKENGTLYNTFLISEFSTDWGQ